MEICIIKNDDMTIEQVTTSRMRADAGKVFRKKSSGVICGDKISLGYDYYDAGVGLSEGQYLIPSDFDEIDIPEGYEEQPVIDQVSRLKRTDELIKKNIAEMNSLGLSAADALAVQNWFPQLYETEGFREGDAIVTGAKVQYDGKLWAARQDHTITEVYAPSIDTAALWVEVTEDYVDGVEQGTKENPIEYDGNMALEEGKYYRQAEVVYLCTRDTINPVYNALADLVGLYVEVAE